MSNNRQESVTPPGTPPDAVIDAVIGSEPPDLAYVDSLLSALTATESLATAALATVSPVEEIVMTTAATTATATTALSFPAQCLLRDAVEWKPQLLEHITANDLVIDLSAVEKVDAAFLQLLVALAKQRQHDGHSAVQWQGISKVMAEGVAVLGLQELLQLPQAA